MLVGVVGFRWMVLATYMSLLVNVTLTAIAWGSLVAGVPFTIQYARQQVAPEFWNSPLFIRINQYITAVWGIDFFLSTLVSLYRQVSGDQSLASQYAPVVFSVGAAVFTVYCPPWYRARVVRPHRARIACARMYALRVIGDANAISVASGWRSAPQQTRVDRRPNGPLRPTRTAVRAQLKPKTIFQVSRALLFPTVPYLSSANHVCGRYYIAKTSGTRCALINPLNDAP